MFLKTFNSEYLYIEVWFTHQSSKQLQIEDEPNITLVIYELLTYKKRLLILLNLEIYYL